MDDKLIAYMVYACNVTRKSKISNHIIQQLETINLTTRDINLDINKYRKLHRKFIILLKTISANTERASHVFAFTITKMSREDIEFCCWLFSSICCFDIMIDNIFDKKDEFSDEAYLYNCNMLQYGKQLLTNLKYCEIELA